MTDGQLGWGDIFGAQIKKRPGKMAGLLRCTEPLRQPYTLRNPGAYYKLTKMATRPNPGTTEYYRAWIAAVAANLNLDDHGLSDDGLPMGVSATEWRREIRERCPEKAKKPTPKSSKRRTRAPRVVEPR